MQIVHSIVATNEERLALLEAAKDLIEADTSKAYTEEERPTVIVELQKRFNMILGEYLHEAFVYGYNEGSAGANKRDTDMYRPTSPLAL